MREDAIQGQQTSRLRTSDWRSTGFVGLDADGALGEVALPGALCLASVVCRRVRRRPRQTVMLEKTNIAERGHRPQSMMPEGLMAAFTPAEVGNLLAYLESLKGK